jgi:hypothetical protein
MGLPHLSQSYPDILLHFLYLHAQRLNALLIRPSPDMAAKEILLVVGEFVLRDYYYNRDFSV